MAGSRNLLRSVMRMVCGTMPGVLAVVLSGAILCGIFPGAGFTVYAQSEPGAEVTPNQVVIEDDAGLLTESETDRLAKQMQSLTEYGHVVFKTVRDNRISVSGYAEAHYRNLFQDQSGMLLLIDTGHEEVYLYRSGKIARDISRRDAESIRKSVQGDARGGRYYYCAQRAFDLAKKTMSGAGMARFTKYACNACLAFILALLINFVAVNMLSKLQKTSDSELLEHTLNYYDNSEPLIQFITQTETYKPRKS